MSRTIDALRRELNRLKSHNRKLRKEIEATDTVSDQIAADNVKMAEEIKKLQKRLFEWEAEWPKYHYEIEALKREKEKLEKTIDRKYLVLRQHGRTLSRLRRALEQVVRAPTLAVATDIAREAIGDDN